MSYYKPTSVTQKIYKLIRLFLCVIRLKLFHKTGTKEPKHTSILMVISKLDRIGGLERQVLELSSALIRYRFLVTIVTDEMDQSPAIEFQSGFVIRRLPRGSNPFLLCIRLAAFVFRHRHTFQMIHIHGVTGFTLLFVAFARMLRRPVLLKGATNGDFVHMFKHHDLKHRLYQRLILSANRFLAISQEIRKELLSCGVSNDRITSIPNAVHSTKFGSPSPERRLSIRTKFSIEADQFVILYLGRLEARKGVDILLKAWQVHSSGGLLCIVGSGPQEQEWKQLSADLNLKNVRFYGATQTPLDFYHCADLFVLPSFREGMPGSLLEAMSCGLPCIATRIGGIVDVMQDGKQGMLITPASVQELGEALQFVASHPEKRIEWGKNAQETIVKEFEMSVIAGNYVSLYKNMLQLNINSGL